MKCPICSATACCPGCSRNVRPLKYLLLHNIDTLGADHPAMLGRHITGKCCLTFEVAIASGSRIAAAASPGSMAVPDSSKAWPCRARRTSSV